MKLVDKICLYYDYKKIFNDNVEEYKKGRFENEEFVFLQYTLMEAMETVRKEIIETCDNALNKNEQYRKYLENIKNKFNSYKQ